MTAELSPDQGTVTISVPLAMRRHGGRKQVVSPAGAPDWAPREAQVDGTLAKALARAFRWRRLLEDGVYGSIAELAAAERISPSYLSRVLRLTLLAPEIVEGILYGRTGSVLTIERLFRPFPVTWDGQCRAVGVV